jgi:hypothetical protein
VRTQRGEASSPRPGGRRADVALCAALQPVSAFLLTRRAVICCAVVEGAADRTIHRLPERLGVVVEVVLTHSPFRLPGIEA